MNTAYWAWALRHGISMEAMQELRTLMGFNAGYSITASNAETEAGAMGRLRLACAEAGMLVWRNNVGAMEDKFGRVVRFGLANDSAALNKSIKSCDLIGIKPGGQFFAREVKVPGWEYSGTDREKAQLKFIELVLSLGGDAAFSTGDI